MCINEINSFVGPRHWCARPLPTADNGLTDSIKAALYGTLYTHALGYAHPMLRLQHLTQSLETETVAFSQFTNTHNCTIRLTVSEQGLHFLAICWLMMHCVVSHFIRTTERNSHYLTIHGWENNTLVLSFPPNSTVCTHADMPTSVHMYESWRRRQWVCGMSWKSSVPWPGLSSQKKLLNISVPSVPFWAGLNWTLQVLARLFKLCIHNYGSLNLNVHC